MDIRTQALTAFADLTGKPASKLGPMFKAELVDDMLKLDFGKRHAEISVPNRSYLTDSEMRDAVLKLYESV